jgi:hypothetical protein
VELVGGYIVKKLSLILTVVVVLLFTGCSNKAGNTPKTPEENNGISVGTNKPNEPAGDKDEKPKGFVFQTRGIDIAMHAEVAPILDKLGQYREFFEAESCAFQGMERVYTYNGFELHTYEMNGVDYVAAVMFLDDSVTTKEGITIDSTFDDVVAAFGDKYTQRLTLYTYELDKTKISFIIEDDRVASVEYMAVPD